MVKRNLLIVFVIDRVCHVSCVSASCSNLSSRMASTPCFITNCPLRWNTGMSHLYLSNHILFSGRLMSTCCRTNYRETGSQSETENQSVRDTVRQSLSGQNLINQMFPRPLSYVVLNQAQFTFFQCNHIVNKRGRFDTTFTSLSINIS